MDVHKEAIVIAVLNAAALRILASPAGLRCYITFRLVELLLKIDPSILGLG
jgi:hypothetical protein